MKELRAVDDFYYAYRNSKEEYPSDPKELIRDVVRFTLKEHRKQLEADANYHIKMRP